MNWRKGDCRELGPKLVRFDDMVEFEAVVWDRGANAHSDPDAARRDGLSRPIASGQHQMAFLHELLEQTFGQAWSNGGHIEVRYVHPVHADDELTVMLEVTEVQILQGGRIEVACDIGCTNQDDVATSRGKARVELTDQVNEPKSVGPLAGLVVLELTHAWAGPYCGMMLADMGADVIKIESPNQLPEARGGYPYVGGESVPFLLLHRGKRSVALDLKSPEGRDSLLELVETADVLIQNFRPGAVERLGLGYEDLATVNPRLVYGSISGYGATGHKSGLPGVNMIAQAESGLAATTMANGSPPRPLGTALCDIVAAMWLCHGITSALIERHSSGEGQFVEASLVDAGLSLMHSPAAMHYYGQASDTGQRYDGNAPSAFLRSSDGRYVAIFASYPALWDRFIASPYFAHLASDQRYVTRESRNQHAEQLHDEIGAIIATRTAPEWESELSELEVPVSVVKTIGEALNDDNVQQRGMLQVRQHPTAGATPMLGVPVKLGRTPGSVGNAAPLLGANTAEVIRSRRS